MLFRRCRTGPIASYSLVTPTAWESCVKGHDILVIGGGIGGLTAAIALCRRGVAVTIVEKSLTCWSVYGVGIIQQANVVRAMADQSLLDEYLDAGVGFDAVEIYLPDGTKTARMPSPRLIDRYPSNVAISRCALHSVFGDSARAAGADIRLCVTVESLEDDGSGEDVRFLRGLHDQPTNSPRRERVTFTAREGGVEDVGAD